MANPIAFAKANKDAIIEQFRPTFCFSENEYSFPTSTHQYAEDVLRVKMNYYAGKTSLDTHETEQYNLIKKHFFKEGDGNSEFYMEGFDNQEVKDYTAKEFAAGDDNPIEDLLAFNEKKHGFSLGSKVPIGGVEPGADKKVRAPLYVSYVPTEDGAIIRYEAFYALSGAIPGTNWLYKMLPKKAAAVFKNFAVHSGDWEGVYIKVKINDEGKASVDHMQTFAHGRSGARKVMSDKLTYDEKGRPCVFVGEATHPSYSDNFPGRSKFLDKVGNGFQLEPSEFVDLSPDVVKPGWAECPKWGGPEIMTKGQYIKSAEEYDRAQTPEDWGKYKYHPISENLIFNAFAKTFQKIKSIINKIIGKDEPEPAKPISIDLPPPNKAQAVQTQVSIDKTPQQRVEPKASARQGERVKVENINTKGLKELSAELAAARPSIATEEKGHTRSNSILSRGNKGGPNKSGRNI